VVIIENGRVSTHLPAAAMAMSPVSPPIVQLGRLAGWSPLPLSVRDARRVSGPMRAKLADRLPTRVVRSVSVSSQSAPLLSARALVVNRGRLTVLRGIGLEVQAGEVVALMGRNGSGKSTLLAAACGQLPARGGSVRTGGLDPASLKPRDLLRHVGLVPQDPGMLLYGETVGAECRAADTDVGAPPGTTRELLVHLAPDVGDATHPRDLSEGQRLALALAIVLAGEPPLVLLDEPTRGLDYGAKTRLVDSLRSLAAEEHGVLVATHDVELVAELADRVVVIADGELVTDGPAAAVLAGSPAFAPQVAKVMHPQPWLTVADVAAALEAS
jgi:energy-coupling factor transport system ATP-binding protein